MREDILKRARFSVVGTVEEKFPKTTATIGDRIEAAIDPPVRSLDVICPLTPIAFGFRKPNELYRRGFVSVRMYCKDEQAATTWRLARGDFSPAHTTTFVSRR